MKKLLPKTKNNTQGFTLVELLVVIAIIAILSVIGVTVFSGVQKNARDAKRKADVDAIITALETKYNAINNTYPAVTAIDDTWFASGTQPKDPNGTGTTPYNLTWSGTAGSSTPCVCSLALDNTTSGNFAAACVTGTTHYCKKGSQN